MNIAYRRMSGPIGLSLTERGTRGMWWEKRRALIATLQNRGHKVAIVNRFTKESAAHQPAQYVRGRFDLLMIEFGSSNANFYGQDLDETERLAWLHQGPIVFLNDDPDLPYRWKILPEPAHARWSVWMNAKYPAPFGGQPESVPCFDFPFSSLQNCQLPASEYDKRALVYMGRPNGRQAAVNELCTNMIPFLVHGRAEEWKAFPVPVYEAPAQPQRAAFYRNSLGCLVLADAKHKRLGWRTGRAYHAVLAGCPAVAEVGHTALAGFTQYENPFDLIKIAERWRNPELRMEDWKQQIASVEADKLIMEETFRKFGL